MIDFKGQTVLITGGSRGIGASAAKLFADYGANVVINYNQDESSARQVLEQSETNSGSARIYKADIADNDQCRKMVDWTVDQFGGLDIVVNNAGIWKESAIEDMTPEKLAETVNCNLNGCFYITTAAVPYMKKQKSGNIVFVSSTAGQRGEAFHSHYAATKGALISLTKSLALELAPYNIIVNCVAPGWVDTDMSHEIIVSEDGPKHLSLIPLGRAATPEEIAWPILFMASGLASFITGEILNVNGGAVLAG
ncbi:MAG: SDR family oxidoreductase [candidate division Zixibacteria bacterium]|nr:SDR family oxidoreductase [candidate division Zixibacteria bacterium]